jgi:hypothetical protein
VKEKIAKAKVWAKENSDLIVGGGFIVGVVGLYAGFIALAIQAAKKQQEENDQLMADLNAAVERGASVLPGPDGYYWILGDKKG